MSGDHTELSWKLQKYGRFQEKDPKTQSVQSARSEDGKWLIIDGSEDEPLTLALTESHHLVISHSDKIQENYSLWNAGEWIRGVNRGDTILILIKSQSGSRRFRVKFADDENIGAQDHCKKCVDRLSKYFSIKGTGGDDEIKLDGDTSIQKLAQVYSGDLRATLPVAYQHSNIPVTELNTAIRLCLSDSNFPAFVGQVEKELAKIAKESTS